MMPSQQMDAAMLGQLDRLVRSKGHLPDVGQHDHPGVCGRCDTALG